MSLQPFVLFFAVSSFFTQDSCNYSIDNSIETKHLSAEEQKFTAIENPDDNLCNDFIWRYEDLWVLMWRLGYVEKLGRPDRQDLKD